MLKRCSPRSSTSAVKANGSASTSAAPFFPVKNVTSSCSVPRATVSPPGGRALEPFLKNTLSRSGIAFGELCMSWRQPAAASTQTSGSRGSLRLNFIDLTRMESLQELQRPLAIELRIVGLDQQEELVARGVLEARHVERRVIRLRQPVQDEHPQHGRDRREENRQLEGHRNVLRPAVERLAGDVDRIRQLVHPLLKADTGQQPGDAAAQDDQREPLIVMADRLPRFLDRERRERVELAI